MPEVLEKEPETQVSEIDDELLESLANEEETEESEDVSEETADVEEDKESDKDEKQDDQEQTDDPDQSDEPDLSENELWRIARTKAGKQNAVLKEEELERLKNERETKVTEPKDVEAEKEAEKSFYDYENPDEWFNKKAETMTKAHMKEREDDRLRLIAVQEDLVKGKNEDYEDVVTKSGFLEKVKTDAELKPVLQKIATSANPPQTLYDEAMKHQRLNTNPEEVVREVLLSKGLDEDSINALLKTDAKTKKTETKKSKKVKSVTDVPEESVVKKGDSSVENEDGFDATFKDE